MGVDPEEHLNPYYQFVKDDIRIDLTRLEPVRLISIAANAWVPERINWMVFNLWQAKYYVLDASDIGLETFTEFSVLAWTPVARG